MSERPTPHSIGVCVLIALHSDPESKLNTLHLTKEQEVALDQVLEACAGAVTLSTTPLSSLAQWLETSVLRKCGRDVFNIVLATLVDCAQSVDGLLELMLNLREISIDQGLVDSNSVHGLYLRSVCLGYEELSFEATCLLWQTLHSELDELYQKCCRRKQEAQKKKMMIDKSSDDENEDMGIEDSDSSVLEPEGSFNFNFDSSWPLSPSQLERQLRQQCQTLAEQTSELSSTATFETIELQIRKILEHDSELTAAYFLRFLNCIQYGERVLAMDALHQYFDHALMKGGASGESESILQYAAILLAYAHQALGNEPLAEMATHEAVRVAQQSQDASCVAFALGWLAQYNQPEDDVNSTLLDRCIERAGSSSSSLRSLIAGANFSWIQQNTNATSGSSSSTVSPSDLWTRLQDATSERTAGVATPALDRPMTLDPHNDRSLQQLTRQRMVAAGIWNAYQQSHLSGLYSFVSLHCGSNASNQGVAMHSVATSALYSSAPSSILGNDGKACIYATALNTLVQLQHHMGTKIDTTLLQPTMTLLLHEWSVRRGELQDAKQLGMALDSQLHPRLSSSGMGYYQLRIDVGLQKALLLSHQGNWDEARSVLKSMIQICQEHHMVAMQVRVLTQLAWVQLEASSSSATCVGALPPVLEALALAEAHDLDGWHATALSLLAKVFLRLEQPKRAIALLQASVPTLRRQGHAWYAAEASLTMVHCLLKLNKVPKAQQELVRCRHSFHRCHDVSRLREVVYLQAQIANTLKQTKQRDACSQAFVELSRTLQSSGSSTNGKNPILDSLGNAKQLESLVQRSIPVPLSA